MGRTKQGKGDKKKREEDRERENVRVCVYVCIYESIKKMTGGRLIPSGGICPGSGGWARRKEWPSKRDDLCA